VRGPVFGQRPTKIGIVSRMRGATRGDRPEEPLKRRAKPAADILQAKGHELRALSYIEAVRRSMYEHQEYVRESKRVTWTE
jgi:hypothetical protein